jgi:hypothetical protein
MLLPALGHTELKEHYIYIHTYTHTFTDPISTQVGLDMEFVKNRVDCIMQSSQNTETQMRYKVT